MINNVEQLPHDRLCKDKLHYLIGMLLQNIPDVRSVVLFGSYARFEQRVTSDIDILVLTENIVCREIRGEWRSLFDEMNADLVFYTNDKFKNSDSLLVRQIKQDGVLLWKI